MGNWKKIATTALIVVVVLAVVNRVMAASPAAQKVIQG